VAAEHGVDDLLARDRVLQRLADRGVQQLAVLRLQRVRVETQVGDLLAGLDGHGDALDTLQPAGVLVGYAVDEAELARLQVGAAVPGRHAAAGAVPDDAGHGNPTLVVAALSYAGQLNLTAGARSELRAWQPERP